MRCKSIAMLLLVLILSGCATRTRFGPVRLDGKVRIVPPRTLRFCIDATWDLDEWMDVNDGAE